MSLASLLQSKKFAYISLIGAVILGIVSFIYMTHTAENNAKRFEENTISGKISSFKEEHSSMIITLKHHADTEYRFTQETGSHLKKDLNEILLLGDSIFKPAYADTILIVRDGVKTKYPLMKYGK